MGKLSDEEEIDEFEGEEAEADEESDTEAEADAPAEAAPAASGGEDNPEERTVASRQALRDQMAEEIAAFLARGGKIAQIEPNVTADPPRKPDSDYGSRPI